MMTGEQYIQLQHFFSSALMRSVRLLLIFFILITLTNQLSHHGSIKIPLFFFLWLGIIEIFFHYKVFRYRPTQSVNDITDGQMLHACTAMVLKAYVFSRNINEMIHYLSQSPSVVFLLERAGIAPEELLPQNIDKVAVLQYSVDIVKTMKGMYCTGMDVMSSYLLLTEPQTKLLFKHKIHQTELLHILYWTRTMYPQEEFSKLVRVNFSGEGLGEALINGWTLETKKYTVNFTYSNALTKPFLTGREELYKLLLEGLNNTAENNILLVGEAGVGKENLVAKLADDSYEGLLSPFLNHKKILQLMVGPLIAGAENRGELESRLQSVIEEISHAHNVILYIPDFENLMGSSSFGLDVSGALMPYLKSGTLPIIASMTSGNFKTYLQHNPLNQVFTVIQVDEPSKEIAIQMLLSKASTIEQHAPVILTYPAIVASVTLADRYDQDAVLPGSAVTLLNDAANSVALSAQSLLYAKTHLKIVSETDIQDQLRKRSHVTIGTPNLEEKDLLLHLEDKLHERVIDQVQAIKAISEAIRRLRSELTNANRPISFLFLGPTGVGKSETAKALASVYFGGEDKMIRLDMSEYSDVDGERRLLGSAPGEGEERGELTDKIHDNPFSLVFLDEFEKASSKILNLFLQVLEDGRLTDNKGRTVSFANCIIIATSNAGAEFIREQVVAGKAVDASFQQQLLAYLQENQLFKPELLNRFDDVITFTPLGEPELRQITGLLLQKVTTDLAQQDITISFDASIIQKIITEGADIQFGARPLRRYIQDVVEDVLAKKKLQDEITRGDTVSMTVGTEGTIQCRITHSAL